MTVESANSNFLTSALSRQTLLEDGPSDAVRPKER